MQEFYRKQVELDRAAEHPVLLKNDGHVHDKDRMKRRCRDIKRIPGVVYHVPMGLDAKGMTWFKTRGTGTNCVESYHSQGDIFLNNGHLRNNHAMAITGIANSIYNGYCRRRKRTDDPRHEEDYTHFRWEVRSELVDIGDNLGVGVGFESGSVLPFSLVSDLRRGHAAPPQAVVHQPGPVNAAHSILSMPAVVMGVQEDAGADGGVKGGGNSASQTGGVLALQQPSGKGEKFGGQRARTGRPKGSKNSKNCNRNLNAVASKKKK